MEAHVIGFNMWVKAVEKAGTTNADKVIDSIVGIKVPNLTGGVSEMLPNHHITKPVLIGEIQKDGQFNVVWKTDDLAGRRVVGLPRGVEAAEGRLDHPQMRQLQHRYEEVRRTGLIPS